MGKTRKEADCNKCDYKGTHKTALPTIDCPRCGIEIELECKVCRGEGEIETMEVLADGSPHRVPTGTKKCICQLNLE